MYPLEMILLIDGHLKVLEKVSEFHKLKKKLESVVKGENIEVELVVNKKTIPRYVQDAWGNRYDLKTVSKKSLEDYAENLKQVIIKKHSKK